MINILLIDNYDSFTMNLAHALERDEHVNVSVCYNSSIPEKIDSIYQAVVLSPGPGLPVEAGNMPVFLKHYTGKYPLLGVCLGHQAIFEHFGGSLRQLNHVYHGIARTGKVINNDCLFNGLEPILEVGSYHSWIADKRDIPTDIRITAVDENDEILAFRHTKLPVFGVQFHPESILTPQGPTIIQNWLDFVKSFSSAQSLS